jgi:3-oxoacyl-[acyl-carrier-protein] synthase-3
VWTDGRALKVLGTGSALPGPAVTTGELLDRMERRFGVAVARAGGRVAARLGIETRHVCRDFEARHEVPRSGHSNPELAAAAVQAALSAAGLGVDDLAYLIGHTATPAWLVPPNAALVADRLGFRGPYLELRQACTGFANALVIAQGVVAAPAGGPVAIVGSETGSVHFDPLHADDPWQLVNLVQMGDGAGAIVVGPDDGRPGSSLGRLFFGQIGLGRKPGLALATGGSEAPLVSAGVLEFAHDYAAVRAGGPELFARGVAAARALGVDVATVDRVIPHQANGRLGELLGPPLGIAPARVFVNASRLGNTGSAAMWLALAELRQRLDAGARVLALGAEATKYLFGGFVYVHG